MRRLADGVMKPEPEWQRLRQFMLAQGCHAHHGRMATKRVVRLHPSGAAYGKAGLCSEDVVVDMGLWKAGLYLGRDNRAVLEGALPPGSKRRIMDLGHSHARTTLVPPRQGHPSNGGKNAIPDPEEGRIRATKERRAGAHAD